MQRSQMWKKPYLSDSRIPTFCVLNWFSYLISLHTSSFFCCCCCCWKPCAFKSSLISIFSHLRKKKVENLIWNWIVPHAQIFFFHYLAICLTSYTELRKQTLLEISVGPQESLEMKPRNSLHVYCQHQLPVPPVGASCLFMACLLTRPPLKGAQYRPP